MVPSGFAMVAMSPVSGWSLARWGGRAVLIVGAGLMALTYLGRVFYADSVLAIVVGSTLVGIGTALAFAAMPTLIMSSVPITETASANGLNSLVRSIGTSLASTLVAAIMATRGTTGDRQLKPILFHPAIKRCAGQAQFIRSL